MFEQKTLRIFLFFILLNQFGLTIKIFYILDDTLQCFKHFKQSHITEYNFHVTVMLRSHSNSC